MSFETKHLPSIADYLAPDTSEIRRLSTMQRGGLAHCTLPPGRTTAAVRHKHVEEIWYFLSGTGDVWRSLATSENSVKVSSGDCLTLPTGCLFQFRNTGDDPLCFLIATMPPWPGDRKQCESLITGRCCRAALKTENVGKWRWFTAL
jgi:mannose-6-phosphate isomerase-like protein (cupin superfamily)